MPHFRYRFYVHAYKSCCKYLWSYTWSNILWEETTEAVSRQQSYILKVHTQVGIHLTTVQLFTIIISKSV